MPPARSGLEGSDAARVGCMPKPPTAAGMSALHGSARRGGAVTPMHGGLGETAGALARRGKPLADTTLRRRDVVRW